MFIPRVLTTVGLVALVHVSTAFRPTDQLPGHCLSGDALSKLALQHNLTEQEITSLPLICLPLSTDLTSESLLYTENTVPDSIKCHREQWCDSSKLCSEICSKGSVDIDPWYDWAAAWQRNLSDQLPFCYSSILGSHNTAISLSNGYGNQDQYWKSYFKYVPTAANYPLLTNNQWLSLTDQLKLGVRLVELDTHFFDNALRIGHCGGLHSQLVSTLLNALNALSKFFGGRVRWDTETVGCSPSLSGIPTKDQRLFSDALKEISDWMHQPDNADQFVVLFLDDEKDLAKWDKVDIMSDQIEKAFPAGWFLRPTDDIVPPNIAHGWPSTRALKETGKRMMVISRKNYSAMHSHIFPRAICNWSEPEVVNLAPPPMCKLIQSGESSYDGTFTRVNDCKLVYGPLNCSFSVSGPGDTFNELTATNMADVSTCSWNSVSPDLITPESVKETIWSWADGHPLRALLKITSPPEINTLPPPENCAAVSVSDGRWRTVVCTTPLRVACRAKHLSVSDESNAIDIWKVGAICLHDAAGAQIDACPVQLPCDVYTDESCVSSPGLKGAARRLLAWMRDGNHETIRPCVNCCPNSFAPSFPRNAKDNMRLIEVMKREGVDTVLIGGLRGPLFTANV